MNNDIRETFNRFRKALKEAEEKQNGVFYNEQDELYQTSMQSAKEQFGAVFPDNKKALIYYQDDGNVTLSGIIPSLNDIKFQFKYKSENGNGCFIWTDGQMILSDENLNTLKKVYGVYKNWKIEISQMQDYKPMNLKNEQ